MVLSVNFEKLCEINICYRRKALPKRALGVWAKIANGKFIAKIYERHFIFEK